MRKRWYSAKPVAISLASHERPTGGELLAAISRRIVRLFARHAGKGPTKCKTHWAGPDTLVVMLGGGFTQAERTLFERGRGDEVISYRAAIQDALQEKMRSEIEALTDRKVIAFMSASHQNPDLMAEIFILESQVALVTEDTPG
jgi:uncharacterized protein YbcI